MPVTENIYKMILDNLHITYEPDESTKNRLRNETEAGMEYIRKYCSPAADFSPGKQYGQMLCDYVLRAEAGALETFAQDFAEDITAAGIETEVNGYAEAMGYD